MARIPRRLGDLICAGSAELQEEHVDQGMSVSRRGHTYRILPLANTVELDFIQSVLRTGTSTDKRQLCHG